MSHSPLCSHTNGCQSRGWLLVVLGGGAGEKGPCRASLGLEDWSLRSHSLGRGEALCLRLLFQRWILLEGAPCQGRSLRQKESTSLSPKNSLPVTWGFSFYCILLEASGEDLIY